MGRSKLLAKIVLLPLSKVYGMVTGIRNKLFDFGLLKQKEFEVPVVVVGNLAVGGTGKTPHVEYIVDTLRHSYHIGVVSRGYKRKTKGFVMATQRSTPQELGDEPYQIYQKFGGEVEVAVCEDRVAGITELLKIDPNINLVVLDDAFQHRYVHPTAAIVVTEYGRPVFTDKMLPYGRLRESRHGLKRANIVIVSKCPDNIKAVDYKIFNDNLDLFPYQKSFFTQFAYDHLRPVFPDQAPSAPPSLEWMGDDDMVLALAGIDNPRPFVRYVKGFQPRVLVNIFPDHHNFTKKDLKLIKSRYESMDGRTNIIVTTEKDAVRLANNPYFPHELKSCIYYLPVHVELQRNESTAFEECLRKLIKSKLR